MLGRFRMPVSDCLEEYENFAGEIFGNPVKWSFQNLPIFSPSKFNTKRLERVFERLISEREERTSEPPYMLGQERGITKVYV